MRSAIVVVLMVGAALVLPCLSNTADAACVGTQPVSACNTTCTSNCYLHDDLYCGNSGSGVILNTGMNLDMCGHTITCTGTGCIGAAVKMTGSSSKVFNSISSQIEAVITGPFSPGINCWRKTSSQVIGIRFVDQTGFTAIEDCAKVQGNVMINSGGILSYGIADSDRITENYLEGDQAEIYYYGDKDGQIDHNVLISNYTSSTTGIIDISWSTGSVDISDNIIMGSGAPTIIGNSGTYGSTYASNRCEGGTTPCATCQSNGYCQTPKTTYTYP